MMEDKIMWTCQEQLNKDQSFTAIMLDFVTFGLVLASCPTPQECTVVPFVLCHFFSFSRALTIFVTRINFMIRNENGEKL